jgi:hypothetical protein
MRFSCEGSALCLAIDKSCVSTVIVGIASSAKRPRNEAPVIKAAGREFSSRYKEPDYRGGRAVYDTAQTVLPAAYKT